VGCALLGTIGPLKSRANHRHHRKNESFLVWGAHGKWRVSAAFPKLGADSRVS